METPRRPNRAQKMLEATAEVCWARTQRKKEKTQTALIMLDWTREAACCFAIHEGLTASNANLSRFQPRISKRPTSMATKKSDTCRMKGSDRLFAQCRNSWRPLEDSDQWCNQPSTLHCLFQPQQYLQISVLLSDTTC